MNYSESLSDQILQGLNGLFENHGLAENQIEELLETPKNDKMGDLAFPCFVLAKSLKKAPPLIAKELCEKLESSMNKDLFESVVATGPYLNFKFNGSALAKNLIENILSEKTVSDRANKNVRMMIEFSQPNTHKAIHVGHVRNMALGDSLVKLSRWAGYEVIAANYIGDVGTHIAKCLWYYTKYYDGETPSENLGEFIGKFYEKGNDKLDFSELTYIPHMSPVSAEVLSVKKHPKNEKLNIVSVKSSEEFEVVCGGKNYNVGDIVAYVPVGSVFRGRLTQVTDLEGVKSEGLICSEAELNLSDEKDKIFTFNDFSTTAITDEDLKAIQFVDKPALGVPLAVLFTKPSVDLETDNVVTEMQTLEKEVQDLLKKFEGQDPEMVALWKKTRQWSLDEFNGIYKWLDVSFDHIFYESEVGDEGKKIVKKALEDGILKKSEGAVGADLTEFNLPFFLLLKSNGTGLYSTKDIALAQRKFKEFKIEKNVYIVDVSQSLHFQQTFKTLELMGFENAKNSHHFPYGMVERPEGKMSSRKGNVIFFSQLQSLLMNKIYTEFLSKYESEWSKEEIEDTAHKISVATIKYGMLNQDNNKKIVFDLDEWTSRTGNTGPYLMYAYARTQSILRDAGKLDETLTDYSLLINETELKLLKTLEKFEALTMKAAENFEPQSLCIYLYQLSKDFSSFYTQCSILKAENEALKVTRLQLMKSFAIVLKKGLNLLGIQVADKM